MTECIKRGDAVDLDVFHTPMASNGDNNDEDSIMESQGEVNRDRGGWANQDYKIHWKDIIVSAGESNIVKKSKNLQFTKLVGIQDGDKVIPTTNIMLDQFRKMASHFKLTGSRHKAKKDLSDQLVKYRAKVEHELATGTVNTDGQLVRINIKRYLNVLFSETMKPILVERGKNAEQTTAPGQATH